MTTDQRISTEDASYRKRVPVLDTDMAYVDVGEGDPIVFLHGNPTPSYLWRDIIPHVLPLGRCLAPDCPGMGNSGPIPRGRYRYFDQQRYLDAWFDSMGVTDDVILVVHDWGSALGFVILRDNLFIEYLLPLRNISEEALEVYRRHYRNPGASRQPMLSWTRDLPIAGEPADVVEVVERYSEWLSTCDVPKLFVDAEPAGFLLGEVREFCRSWPHQETVVVDAAHFPQEESPQEVGRAVARFIARVLASGRSPGRDPGRSIERRVGDSV